MRFPCRTIALLALLLSAPAWAQTDADKATARTLAEEGIALKQEGKHQEALDKLTRAQQIFDAPTHLLLIAQCQVALGKLVEGAETYRRLQKRVLPADAPPAFHQAKKAADEELKTVEPRIPKIRLRIEPEGVQRFEVRIDGARVPPAVVGVDRVENPGHHVVEVSAPGYRTAQVQLQLSEGQVLPVEVKLEADGTPVAPPPPTAPTTGSGSSYTPPPPPPAGRRDGEGDGDTDLLLSLRLQSAIPEGDFGTTTFDQVELKGGNVGDSFGPGGGLELRGDLRFGEWAVGLMFGVDGFGQVTSDDYGGDLKALYPEGEDFEAKESFGTYGGVSGQWYGCPDCFGFVGEVGITMRQFTQTIEFRPETSESDTCTLSLARDVPMLRLLGGLQIPVGGDFSVMPFASISAGSVTATRLEPTAGNDACPSNKVESSNTSESSVSLFTLGVAGTMSLGLD